MRILTIRLKNINSLRGEHEIDFTASPLKESGLFGIVGATGSGKSTLLDSITLALFGKVPRIGAVTKGAMEKGGIVLTKHEKECYAEITYECKNGIFTAQWSVSKARTGSLRDVQMKVLDQAGAQVNEGLKDAPMVNAGNIGLDYDQFVKSILLCQGDFARFLQSGKNERALLLEKITGTHTFRNIGKKAYNEYNKRKRALDNKIEVMAELGRGLMSDALRAELEKEIGELNEKTVATEQRLELVREKLRLKLGLRQLKEKLDGQHQRKVAAELALNEFEKRNGAALQHYNKLFIYKDKLAEHGRLAQAMDTAKEAIAVFEDQIAAHDEAIENLVKELREWVGEEVSAGDYVKHLRAYRDKVRDAQKDCAEKQQALTACLGRLNPMFRLEGFQHERSLFRPDSSNELLLSRLRGRMDTESAAYHSRIVNNGLAEDALEDTRNHVSGMMSDLVQLKGEVRSYTERLGQVKLLKQRIEGLERKLKEFDMGSIQDMLGKATAAFDKARQERDQLLEAERLEDLRKTLKDGEPCPLCGAEHHPYLHEFAAGVLKAGDDLAKAKQEYERCKKAYEDGVLQMGQLNLSVEREKQALDAVEKEKERIKDLVEQLKLKLGIDKVQSEDKVQELVDAHRNKLAALDECIRYRQWQPQASQLVESVDEYDVLFASLTQARDSLASLYTGTDINADCQSREDAIQKRQYLRQEDSVKLGTAKEQQHKDAKSAASLHEALHPLLTGLGYSGIAEARSLLITEVEQKALVEERSLISQELVGSTKQLEVLQGQWDEAARDDDATVSLEQQQQLAEATETELKGLRETSKQRFASLQTDDSMRSQLAEHETEKNKLQEELRPWEMLNRYIGDATGNKFNNYAQELTLRHLLILANRRMDKLHSRYKLLMPEKLEDDDLRVEDGYMGNEVRTVRSLSGGETFVLSLALALGLSDLASKDIRIDSLFVDEGFGSLDPDTLEEAMSTLEQLQSESNKTVGIISHVESLKDRIYTQIRLTKSNSGFSTLRIFPETGSTHEAEL